MHACNSTCARKGQRPTRAHHSAPEFSLKAGLPRTCIVLVAPLTRSGAVPTTARLLTSFVRPVIRRFSSRVQRNSFGRRILDGAFNAMARAIYSGATPHLLMLRYDSVSWMARDLIFVPNFAFTMSSIEKRAALTATAQRAGWIGCNILICNVPVDLRIPMISAGEIQLPQNVRRRYKSVESLKAIWAEQRGWTLDVLNIVRRIGRSEFELGEVYEHAAELEALHPNNKHIHAKIRQQLQRLRDLGFLRFSNLGVYRLLR
jgi:type II restriction enzyme